MIAIFHFLFCPLTFIQRQETQQSLLKFNEMLPWVKKSRKPYVICWNIHWFMHCSGHCTFLIKWRDARPFGTARDYFCKTDKTTIDIYLALRQRPDLDELKKLYMYCSQTKKNWPSLYCKFTSRHACMYGQLCMFKQYWAKNKTLEETSSMNYMHLKDKTIWGNWSRKLSSWSTEDSISCEWVLKLLYINCSYVLFEWQKI